MMLSEKQEMEIQHLLDRRQTDRRLTYRAIADRCGCSVAQVAYRDSTMSLAPLVRSAIEQLRREGKIKTGPAKELVVPAADRPAREPVPVAGLPPPVRFWIDSINRFDDAWGGGGAAQEKDCRD